MRAVQVRELGEPQDVVSVADVDEPRPGPGQALVRVAAGSLNFGDVARCRGGVASVTPDPPFTLGMDMTGVVEEAGDGLEDWLGRRVVGIAAQSLGGLAELAVAGNVFDAPPDLDDEEAAAFVLPFHVSYLALHERAGLQAGETVLVRGGASAVGTAAIQLAKAAGARVIASACGPEKGEVCRSVGADLVLDHGADDVFAAVMDETDDRGADVIFDPIGGEATETTWTCAALGGRYLAVGFNGDPQSGLTGRPLRKVSMLNLTVMGVLLAYFDTPRGFRQFGINAFPPETGDRVHAALLDMVAGGAVRPYIGRRIGMDEVGATLADHAAGRTSGRSVVRIA